MGSNVSNVRINMIYSPEEEKQIEREQVEHVFSLCGELENPWIADNDSFPYWFENVPDWCKKDFPDRFDRGVNYRTVIEDCAFSLPPEIITHNNVKWIRKAVLGPSSGECECPLKQDEISEVQCKYCDCDPGQKHEFVFIGDGWCEVVYRSFEREITCEYIDTCLSCYLQDHYSRPGELLLSLDLNNQTKEEAANELYDEYSFECSFGSDLDEEQLKKIDDSQLKSVFKDAVHYVSFESDETESQKDCDGSCDPCKVWFVLRWSLDCNEK